MEFNSKRQNERVRYVAGPRNHFPLLLNVPRQRKTILGLRLVESIRQTTPDYTLGARSLRRREADGSIALDPAKRYTVTSG